MPPRYLETHPFLTFESPDLRTEWRLWMQLGEALSKCQHIAGAPLPPVVAADLMGIYMAKGVHATTSIEGNTLSVEEVREVLGGKRTQPPSREYQEVEVLNVARALRGIDSAVEDGRPMSLDVARLKEFNLLVLDGTEHEKHAIPGEFRQHSVGVPSYRAVPHADVDYLIERLLAWIGQMAGADLSADLRFAQSVVAAITAHVYLAWIHPFGDGNGRTARLVEAQVLANAGVPLPAINLLSDHYNKTRDRYFRMFNESRESRDLRPFLRYAVEGFVDGLWEQVDRIRETTLHVSWINFVHETLRNEPDGATRRRRRDLVLAMSGRGDVSRSELTMLTPELAKAYATKGEKTVTRDINRLESLQLVRRTGRHTVTANSRIMEAFLPKAASELR